LVNLVNPLVIFAVCLLPGRPYNYDFLVGFLDEMIFGNIAVAMTEMATPKSSTLATIAKKASRLMAKTTSNRSDIVSPPITTAM
jgi:hypothetical protein